MPLFFLGTREWRNRQTRTVQVRVPVMEWGFNSPLAHDETADPLRICGFCFPWLLLVAPRVFWAPRGLSRGPGCLLGLAAVWPACKPSAPRAFGSARRLEARPGPAAAHGCRSQALRRPPAPSTPVGPGVLLTCGSARRLEARPGPATAHGHRSLAPPLCVGVMGVSRVECLGCSGACCYKRRQSKVFFVWLSAPLLRTLSIRGLFR